MRWLSVSVVVALLGVPAAAEAGKPEKLAKQITSAPDLEAAVKATRKALVAGGVGVVSNGKVVQRAKKPAPIAASETEVLNLAYEALHRKTAGGTTLKELAATLRTARFPFRKPRKAANALRKYLQIWVRSAQRRKGDPRSFNARFLAAMAKSQGQPIDLAKGNYDPASLRLTRLEVQLFVAAFQRGPKRLWAGSRSGRGSANVAQDNNPCSDYRKFQKEQLKELYGEKVANDLDEILDTGFKMVAGELKDLGKPAVEKGVALGIEQAILNARGRKRPGQRAKGLSTKAAQRLMSAVNLLLKAQKLATLYGSVGIQVFAANDTGLPPDTVHKPHGGSKEKRAFAALVGIDPEDQQEYEALKQKRAGESDLMKAMRDCLKLLDLPSLTDTGDVAEEMEKWRVKWSFEMLPNHAEINVKDTNYDAGLFKQSLRKINTYQAAAGPVYVNIKPEGPNDRDGCQPGIRETYVNATADLDMSKPPGLSTVIDVVSGNVPGVVLEAAEQMFLQLVKPSGAASMIVKYHVPDKATASVSQVCRPYPKAWSGTLSGQMTDDGGRVQAWTATVTFPLDPDFDGSDGFAWYHNPNEPEGTATWQLSGTDEQGCAWEGGGEMPVTGELSLTKYEGIPPTYELKLHKGGFGGEATHTCPGQQPSTGYWEPLLFASGEMCNPGPLPYNDETTVTGEAHYTREQTEIDCNWSLNAQY